MKIYKQAQVERKKRERKAAVVKEEGIVCVTL